MVTYGSMKCSDCMWCTYMLDRDNIPFMVVNLLTWHGIKMMHYQNKSSKSIYNTSCLIWDALMRSLEAIQYSRARFEGLPCNCSLTVQACQWDKWCALQKPYDAHLPGPRSTRMCPYREDYIEISDSGTHCIMQQQGSRTKLSCTYKDSSLSSAWNTPSPKCRNRSCGSEAQQGLKKSRYLITINHGWFKPNVQVHLLALAINLFIVIRTYRLLPKN